MKIIDLSQPLFDHMPVYPGDPEVVIEEIHALSKEGWNLKNMTISTHIGTHVNVPYHMVKNGNTLDDLSIDCFFGRSLLYKKSSVINNQVGIIFTNNNIDSTVANQLIKTPPKFIGLSANYEFDVEIERLLLKHGIISFENLINTQQLPPAFTFYGVPLNIRGGDGSPVRAFAMFE